MELQPGDRIAIVGHALADRLQHSGYWETLIHQAHPQHQLVVRNLAVAGDEVATWHRSESFGSRDEWFKQVGADVIFAFYGFNESFKGYDGVERFKQELEKFLKETAAQNYGGKGAPRIVLFSPAAAERHPDANFPDPKEINENVQTYSAAMEEVARKVGVQFVDLLNPTASLMKAAAAKGQSMTVNGLLLKDAADKALAPVMFEAVFGKKAPAVVDAKLLAAVNEKNFQWHQRYRTIDGYNVYGGRSRLEFKGRLPDGTEHDKISNNAVMQREMQQRDVMTANRDKRVWAVAGGGDLVVKDDNLPAPVVVGTNKPGDKPDGSHTYLGGEEALAKIKTHSGTKINLFADEKQFPELANPVQMAWDTRGRLWVAVWPNYPSDKPTAPYTDKLIILEDTDKDGRADQCTTFIDNLNGPTGFAMYKDGVLLMQAPDLWYVRDTDGDGKADSRERILMGIDSADSHHTTNAMGPGVDGAVYLSDGVFHRTQVETHVGPKRHSDGIIWRYEPTTAKFEQYAPYGFANPHGKVWDRWGNDIITDATGNASYFAPAFSGYLESGKHPSMKQFWDRPSRPCPGTGMVSSRHFPEDWQGNFLNINVIGFQGIYRVGVSQDGSGLKGQTLEHLVYADPKEHPTFRPICVSTGPDGAIYFCDWSQTIIGHMQHNMRDPNRDNKHGRVYRITYEGRPLLTPPKIHGQPVEALLEVLKVHEDDTRILAKIELSKHETQKVLTALKQWIADLDKADKNHEHHLTEALWVHQWHNSPEPQLLQRVLNSPQPEARAAATRVLGYWRDRIPNTLALLQERAADADPRVRLYAVRAASFFNGKDVPTAAQIAYTALAQETDYYLDYTIGETLRQLRSIEKNLPFPTDAKAAAKLVAKMSDSDLGKAPKNEFTLRERIARKTTDLATRDAALGELAKLKDTSKVALAIAMLTEAGDNADLADALAKQLALATPTDLSAERKALSTLVQSSTKNGAIQRAALAASVVADGQPQTLWAATANDASQRRRLVDSIRLITDPTLRAKFQPLLVAVLGDAATPADLRSVTLKSLPLMGAAFAKENFTLLANALRAGTDRPTAAAAILQLPRDAWNQDAAGPVATAILEWARTIPAAQRSTPEIVTALQFGSDIAALLPASEATRIRKELRSLGVSVFVLRTVHEQMRYDVTRLVVEAGKPFEILLENSDAMPHNLVVVKPGSKDKVGIAAATLNPVAVDKQGRTFVPNMPEVLAATKMLEPGQKETLKMTAPTAEGEYEYVCTFPGHYSVMWGKLIVTKDVDAYLAANPGDSSIVPAAQHTHPAK